jgi:capsular polysaccharide biosynthesis protein
VGSTPTIHPKIAMKLSISKIENALLRRIALVLVVPFIALVWAVVAPIAALLDFYQAKTFVSLVRRVWNKN